MIPLTKRFALQQGLHWMIVGLIIPVLTLLFQAHGLNLAEIGIIMAVWVGTTAILEIPLGSVADHFGRRSIYLMSLLMNIIGCTLLYFADSFEWLLMASVILGASRAVYSGTLDAWFYDRFQQVATNSSYHAELAKVNIVVTFGLAIGCLIGGWLPDYTIKHYLAGHQSLTGPAVFELNIFAIIAGNLLLFAVTLLLVDEVHIRSTTTLSFKLALRTSLKAMAVARQHSILLPLMISSLLMGMTLSVVEHFWQPYLAGLLDEQQYALSVFGVISALYFLMAASSSGLSIYFLKWFEGSHRMLLLSSRLLAAMMLMALAMSDDLISFSLSYLAFFFLFTAGNNSESVLLNQNTQSDMRSTMLSIHSFIITIGGMSSSLLFGYVSQQLSISISWLICGCVLLLGCGLFLRMPNHIQAEPEQA